MTTRETIQAILAKGHQPGILCAENVSEDSLLALGLPMRRSAYLERDAVYLVDLSMVESGGDAGQARDAYKYKFGTVVHVLARRPYRYGAWWLS